MNNFNFYEYNKEKTNKIKSWKRIVIWLCKRSLTTPNDNYFSTWGGMKYTMQDGYIKEQKIVERTEIEKELELLHMIVKTKQELKIANANFEYTKDDLVDYYVYQIKANQAKLDYLIKLAKTKGISVDMINEIKLRNWQDDEEIAI